MHLETSDLHCAKYVFDLNNNNNNNQNSHDNKRFISELGKQCGIVNNIRNKDASFVVKVNQMSLYIEAGKPKI